MKRARLAALAAGLVLAAPASATGRAPTLGQEGRWITDEHGRVVFVHAVNMVYKRAPYYPKAVGFGADDARFLRRHGFNGVRLGVIYKGIEPRPGRYDDGYIAHIAKTQRVLANHDVFSQIDFHQDLYNEKFQGEGWPDWAVQDDGLPNPKNGFPGNYLTNPALQRAFDHFWANDPGPGGVGLVRRYADAWRHVARRFRSADRVLGYDVMNEPWPGTVWQPCANPAGCPQFDTGPLAAMTRKVTGAIRDVDRRHIVWHEPNVLFDFGAQTHLPKIGSNSGFSFHDYCLENSAPSCPTTEAHVFDNADDEARQTDRALMLTEFGATDERPRIQHIVDLADQHMVSWMWWAYCGCDDPTTSGPGNLQAIVKDPAKPPRGSNVLHRKLALIDRPYPQVVAGTPTSFGYNRDANTFHLTYRATAPDGERLPRRLATRIYVPRTHYPRGFWVRARGARFAYSVGRRYLFLRRKPGAREVHVRLGSRQPG
jgi:endoglycosylceramidase